MSFTIKHSGYIITQNAIFFSRFVTDVDARTSGATISFTSTTLVNNKIRITYNIVCDTRQIAEDTWKVVKDGLNIYG